jgi:hypothetical protein
VKGDLERFRDLIEQRGSATGAWRGEIHETGGTGLGGGIDSRMD